MSYGLQCGPSLGVLPPTFDTSLDYTLFYYDEFDVNGLNGSRAYPELVGRKIAFFPTCVADLNPISGEVVKNFSLDYPGAVPTISWSTTGQYGIVVPYHVLVHQVGDL